MRTNSLLDMGPSGTAEIGNVGRIVQNYYLNAVLSINVTTLAPTTDYVVFEGPGTFHRIVEIVGILAALAVGAIIIVGVAFIMSKLRKRNVQDDDASSAEVVIENNLPNMEANLPHYDIKHVYSISGIYWSPKPKRSIKTILVPNFLKRKPNDMPAVHEAIKKDLSRIYVY